RKVLERIPDGKLDYKPHTKSMEFGRLASHVAEMVGWMKDTISTDSFDVNPPGGQPYQFFFAKSNQDLMATFDKNVAEVRAALASASDAALMTPWSLKSGGQAVFTMPRIACIRGMLMNHTIHHRGQLSVYLRLNDLPVPAMYGPSADEGQM